MFDEIVHARFASAGHAQCDQNGHVANDDEDQQNPQKGQLLRLISGYTNTQKKKKREKIEQHKRFRYHLDCLSIQVTGLLVRKLFHLTFAIIYDPIGSKRKELKKSKTASSIFSRVARPCLIERASFLRVEKSHQRIPPQKKDTSDHLLFSCATRLQCRLFSSLLSIRNRSSVTNKPQLRVFLAPESFKSQISSFFFLLGCGLIDS